MPDDVKYSFSSVNLGHRRRALWVWSDADGRVYTHWSDCALHSHPARFPTPCDCGGFECNLSAARRYLDLWRARIDWKRETGASLWALVREIFRT